MLDTSCISKPPKKSALVISRHDFRSNRKANMHFIARELSYRKKTRFFSFGFSYLSYLKDDPRLLLWKRSNKPEVVDEVECYLWRTYLHPISLRNTKTRILEALFFKLYVRFVPNIFAKWIKESEVILIESGFPIIFIRICKKLNPNASLIYIASDSLKTIDCANYIIEEFEKHAPLFNSICLPSSKLSKEMPVNNRIYFVPHGLDSHILDHAGISPYIDGIHAVSVGSMLFDADFFKIAAQAFPEITFHIIGGGANASMLSAPNIKKYPEMPYLQTIPFIKHADIGIAPYNGDKVSAFLSDTSLKLMQYGFLGIPSVCPHTVVGNYFGRFGYTPNDTHSIASSVEKALNCGPFIGRKVLSWKEVTDRILDPEIYNDTNITDGN